MTHYPKNPHCEACTRSKMRSSPRSPSSDPAFKKCSQFGDHISADLKTFWLDKKSWGMDGQKCVLVVCDAFTGFIQSYPLRPFGRRATRTHWRDWMHRTCFNSGRTSGLHRPSRRARRARRRRAEWSKWAKPPRADWASRQRWHQWLWVHWLHRTHRPS